MNRLERYWFYYNHNRVRKENTRFGMLVNRVLSIMFLWPIHLFLFTMKTNSKANDA